MTERPLNILILGCLGPNQNRISSLAKTVNRVVYAYTEFHPTQILLDNIVQVAIPRRNMVEFIEFIIIRYEINLIYSLLNAHDGSIEATIELLDAGIKTPIVRHYKEHPCYPTLEEKRTLTETTAQIYINRESLDYFHSIYDVDTSTAHILDADMISETYMTDQSTTKLSELDRKPHLLIAGSLSILNDRLDMREICFEMDKRDICIHLYGNMVSENNYGEQITHDKITREVYEQLTSKLKNTSLHSFISPEAFAYEWSKYDAGLMHAFVPDTHQSALFETINMPYRYSAYLCAGLPICLPDLGQNAMKRFVLENRLGFSFKNYDELAEMLHNKKKLSDCQKYISANRHNFSFEYHIAKLIEILKIYSA